MKTNEELEARIIELENKLIKMEAQQITYPLDRESFEVLNKYFLSLIDEYSYFGGAGANSFRVIVGGQDGKTVDLSQDLIRYSADPTSNQITIIDRTTNSKFATGSTVVLYTSDTMPSPLSGQGLTTYHVVSASADGYTFQLSATSGGASIDITSTGAGRQLLSRI